MINTDEKVAQILHRVWKRTLRQGVEPIHAQVSHLPRLLLGMNFIFAGSCFLFEGRYIIRNYLGFITIL